ncbi:MAG TPA: AbrB/MazE/SpoVT family DNA-binding domain-containing protein [Candidatus Acidoferrales bacterium]|nr:AbrB/MazE/SpoVT family DNA-binding domain-containing protein [Candidatus Acidoferrales bacterium]
MDRVHHATVKVIQNGRVTIPLEIRELEDIKEGDYVEITVKKLEKSQKEGVGSS